MVYELKVGNRDKKSDDCYNHRLKWSSKQHTDLVTRVRYIQDLNCLASASVDKSLVLTDVELRFVSRTVCGLVVHRNSTLKTHAGLTLPMLVGNRLKWTIPATQSTIFLQERSSHLPIYSNIFYVRLDYFSKTFSCDLWEQNQGCRWRNWKVTQKA